MVYRGGNLVKKYNDKKIYSYTLCIINLMMKSFYTGRTLATRRG